MLSRPLLDAKLLIKAKEVFGQTIHFLEGNLRCSTESTFPLESPHTSNKSTQEFWDGDLLEHTGICLDVGGAESAALV